LPLNPDALVTYFVRAWRRFRHSVEDRNAGEKATDLIGGDIRPVRPADQTSRRRQGHGRSRRVAKGETLQRRCAFCDDGPVGHSCTTLG
jgi:hypothetical protein